MSAEVTPASPVEAEGPYGAAPDERATLGTLSWPRAAKIAGLAGAVAALAGVSIAMSMVAGHMGRVEGPPPAHQTSVIVTPERASIP
jgi:hypothetical protein